MAISKTPSLPKTKFSSQALFASSKLIQNLGSNREQVSFDKNLRTVHGRD